MYRCQCTACIYTYILVFYYLILGNITGISIHDFYPACHKEQLMSRYILNNGCYNTGSIQYAQCNSIPQTYSALTVNAEIIDLKHTMKVLIEQHKCHLLAINMVVKGK